MAVSQSRSTPSPLALPVILLAVFVMPIGISGTAVSLPRIAEDLGSDPFLLQSVVNGFNASFAMFTIFWGVVSDRIGYRKTFVAGLVLMIAGSVLSAAAPDLAVLDLGRIVAGLGGAAIFTGAAATLSNADSAGERTRNFAIFGSTLGLGGVIGPTLAGLLIGIIDGRGVFIAHGAVAGLALVLSSAVPAVRVVREPGQKAIDFTLLRNPKLLSLSLVPVADAIGFMTVFTYLPIALAAEHGIDAFDAGLLLLCMTVPVFLGPIISARLLGSFSSLKPMTIVYASLLLLLIGDAGMFLLSPQTPVEWIALPMILLGFAWGLPAGLIDGEAIGAVPAGAAARLQGS